MRNCTARLGCGICWTFALGLVLVPRHSVLGCMTAVRVMEVHWAGATAEKPLTTAEKVNGGYPNASKVPKNEATSKPMTLNRVDTNKSDDLNRKYWSRPDDARQNNPDNGRRADGRQWLVLEHTFSRSVSFLDISSAHFYETLGREVFAEMPAELHDRYEEDIVAMLKKSLYGWQGSRKIQERDYWVSLNWPLKLGLTRPDMDICGLNMWHFSGKRYFHVKFLTNMHFFFDATACSFLSSLPPSLSSSSSLLSLVVAG